MVDSDEKRVAFAAFERVLDLTMKTGTMPGQWEAACFTWAYQALAAQSFLLARYWIESMDRSPTAGWVGPTATLFTLEELAVGFAELKRDLV
ncbi:MAG: hypothetical protein FD144_5866 [Rhodospirillaceae bacterium]|nr:MAG: hypothetical protein FD144_5866 [Rhodospirillaceae bacterium]